MEGLRHLIVDEVTSFREEVSKREEKLRRRSTTVPEKGMETTTATAAAAAATGGGGKSKQRSNWIRRSKSNCTSSHNFGKTNKGSVHGTTSHCSPERMCQREGDSSMDSSTVNPSKSKNKGSTYPPKQHSRCDDSQGEDRTSCSTSCHGTQPSENSSSTLSSTVISYRPTSRGYVERDGGGCVATSTHNYSKNVNDLSAQM